MKDFCADSVYHNFEHWTRVIGFHFGFSRIGILGNVRWGNVDDFDLLMLVNLILSPYQDKTWVEMIIATDRFRMRFVYVKECAWMSFLGIYLLDGFVEHEQWFYPL
jgi:hypothetical protein